MKFLVKLLVVFAVSISGSCIAKELPVETFFKFAEIDRLRLSPTGQYLAARVTKEDSSQLIILDRKTLKMTGKFDFGSGDTQIGEFGWLNDTRVYASMVEKAGPLALPQATGFLFAGNFDGSKKRQLLPQPASARKGAAADSIRRFSIVDLLHDDSKNILINLGGNRLARIVKLNVYNSRQIEFARSPVPDGGLMLDNNKIPRIAGTYDPDTDIVSILHREDEKSEWKEISKYNNKESNFLPIAFTKDNKKFYVEVSKGVNKSIHLFDPAKKSMTLVKKLEGDADTESYLYDDDKISPAVIGYVRQPGMYQKEYFDKNNKYTQREIALDNAFKGKHVSIVNTTRDGKLSMLGVISDRRPVSYYLMNNENFDVKLLMHTKPWIKAKEMSAQTPVSFKARDGLEIRAYLTLPKGKSKNLPFVLVVHGGPYGVRDNWEFDEETQFLANRGYAVMRVNYRGSGGRGLNFEYDNYRKMGMEMQDDLTDATLWAVKQGIADKNRLCIYGGSYGGYASAMAVVKEPDLYKCSIPYAAVFDIEIQNSSDTALFDNGRRFLDEAWNINDEDFVKERSAIYHLDKLKAALFLIHGKADKRVPYSQMEAMADALDKINYPYESMAKDHEPHGFKTEKNRFEMYTRLAKFLEKHIGK